MILLLIVVPIFCINKHLDFIKKDYLLSIILVFLYLIVLCSTLIFINLCIKTCQISKKESTGKNENRENILLNDEIFKDYPRDKVNGLFNIIKSYKSETFFSIGLIGAWGSGKSSFLNKLDSMLTEKNEYVVINLNVWELDSQENLLQELQKELDNKILEHTFLVWTLEIMKSLVRKNYFSILKKYYSFDKSLVNIALSPTIKDSKKQYSNTLKQAFGNKKLIIMIDELDRIDNPKEIYQVFNTIRYLTSFDNTITITAIDINQIQSQIKNIEYIHKIFNTKYFIPIHTKNDLATFLKTALETIKIEFKTSNITDTLLNTVYNFRELKNTINDTYLHIDTLQSSCPEWKNYIFIEFIFILNLIKAINFKVCNKLYQMENLELTEKEIFNLSDEAFQLHFDEMKKNGKFDDKKIEDELKEHYIKDIETLINILKSLGKEKKYDLNSSFYVYKYYKTIEYLITDEELEKFFENKTVISNKLDGLKTQEYKSIFIQNLLTNCYGNQNLLKNTIDIIIEKSADKFINDEVLELIVSNRSNNETLIDEQNNEYIIKIVQDLNLSQRFIKLFISNFISYKNMAEIGIDYNEKILINYIKEYASKATKSEEIIADIKMIQDDTLKKKLLDIVNL